MNDTIEQFTMQPDEIFAPAIPVSVSIVGHPTETPKADLFLRAQEAIARIHSADIDELAMILDLVKHIEEMAGQIRKQSEDEMIERIRADGEIVIGSIRYYVGDKKTTKCIDIQKCIEALLTAAAGDLEQVCKTLSSQPIKHGAAKEILGETEWSKFFVVETETELKEGKPRLNKVDTKFLPGSRSTSGKSDKGALAP